MSPISIIIVTRKPANLTVKSLGSCPVPFELIISKKWGLGYARNWGAKQAKNGFLVFFDDDLTLNEDIWKEILSTKKGQFKMLKVNPRFPSSRVVAIHVEDFWGFGGFDEKIKYSAEDVDFYIRAVNYGLDFRCIPKNLVTHHKHPFRWDYPLMKILIVIGHSRLFAKHGRQYSNFKRLFGKRLRNKQIRTVLISLMALTYYIVRGNDLWKNRIRNMLLF